MTIKFNRLSATFEGSMASGHSNWFFNALGGTEKAIFKKAFGQSSLKAKKANKKRDAAARKGLISGASLLDQHIGNYQEDLIEARQHVNDIIEGFAIRIGAQKGQVVHAVVSGKLYPLLKAVAKNIEAHTKMVDEIGGKGEKTKVKVLTLPPGHIWGPTGWKVAEAEIKTGVEEAWVKMFTVDRRDNEHGASRSMPKVDEDNFTTAKRTDTKGIEVTKASIRDPNKPKNSSSKKTASKPQKVA